MKRVCFILNIWLIMVLALLPWNTYGEQEKNPFSKQEIEQLVAPIALYPDPLLAQILMASTYPLEIVSAARWIKANPNLKDKALEDALQKETWDPSVKSLTAVPDVLNMLNDKLDMTIKLGDAFLGQQKEVLDAVQVLRARAESSGNLKTTKEQVIKREPARKQAGTSGATEIIYIEPADPEVVYVPVYNPMLVYGEWPYPDYLPYSYYPEYYYPIGALLTFGAAIAVGSALWGDFDWRNHDVHINVARYNNFNRAQINNGKWNHQVEHRGNVPYRDKVSQDKFAKDRAKDAQARENFRGRAEEGRREMSGDTKDIAKGDRTPSKAHKGTPQRQPKKATQRPNAYDGINRGGKQARQASKRGHQSVKRSHKGGYKGSPPRRSSMGGGGRRGGGGGRGGGRRR